MLFSYPQSSHWWLAAFSSWFITTKLFSSKILHMYSQYKSDSPLYYLAHNMHKIQLRIFHTCNIEDNHNCHFLSIDDAFANVLNWSYQRLHHQIFFASISNWFGLLKLPPGNPILATNHFCAFRFNRYSYPTITTFPYKNSIHIPAVSFRFFAHHLSALIIGYSLQLYSDRFGFVVL